VGLAETAAHHKIACASLLKPGIHTPELHDDDDDDDDGYDHGSIPVGPGSM